MIKSKRPFTMQAKVEVNILELLRERDPEGKYNCGEKQHEENCTGKEEGVSSDVLFLRWRNEDPMIHPLIGIYT